MRVIGGQVVDRERFLLARLTSRSAQIQWLIHVAKKNRIRERRAEQLKCGPKAVSVRRSR